MAVWFRGCADQTSHSGNVLGFSCECRLQSTFSNGKVPLWISSVTMGTYFNACDVTFPLLSIFSISFSIYEKNIKAKFFP